MHKTRKGRSKQVVEALCTVGGHWTDQHHGLVAKEEGDIALLAFRNEEWTEKGNDLRKYLNSIHSSLWTLCVHLRKGYITAIPGFQCLHKPCKYIVVFKIWLHM